MVKTNPSPAGTLTLLADDAIRSMPDTELGRRVMELNTGLLHFQAIAASAGSLTVRHAVALGQIFEEAFRRHEGQFSDWLKAAVGEDLEGRQRLSEDSARRYRTLWKKRDSLFPPDESAPECKTLTEAYIKVGLIPAPLHPDHTPSAGKALFKLMFSLPEVPVEDWPAAEKRAFLERTQPIVDLRAKLMEAAA